MQTLGAYRLIEQIGEGGMGQVWLAQHNKLDRRAAIKVLHASFSAQPAIVARFFNEARAATRIADPGIVQIFDFGHADDGTAFIVMELLEGEPLDKRLGRCVTLPATDVVRLVRQVAVSLGAAHRAGIVHRDLKPENIFIIRDPLVPGGERTKLLDFGIAKLANDPAVAKTATSALMGTPMYMSPEQCRGAGHVDARSDIYSLGCVMFALLTGRPPFISDGMGELIAMHLREPPPPMRRFVPEITGDLEALVTTCLAKDPAARPASGDALAAALDRLGAVGDATVLSTPSPMPAAVTTMSSAAVMIERRPARARGVALTMVAALAVAAVGVGTIVRGRDAAVSDAGVVAMPMVSAPPPPPDAMPDATPDAILDAMPDAMPDAPRPSPHRSIRKPVVSPPPVAVPLAPPPPAPPPPVEPATPIVGSDGIIRTR